MTVNQTDGSILEGDDVKAFGKIYEIYEGSGFDTSWDGTTSNSYELTDITAANLGNADYLKINMLLNVFAFSAASGTEGENTIKIETKYIGLSSYVDSLPEKVTFSQEVVGSAVSIKNNTAMRTVTWIHTLTANEKSNGVRIRITGGSTAGAGSEADQSNIQTVVSSVFA